MPLLLHNKNLDVQIGDPGELYTGSRFDHSGNVIQVVLNKRHTFCSTEKKEYSQEYGFGLLNEFDINNPAGYTETKAGAKFLKIGVGSVLKENPEPYLFYLNYKFDPLEFKVTQPDDSHVEFKAASKPCAGFQTHYIKVLSVSGNTLTIDYFLKNIGEKSFSTEEYCHNFLAIDKQDIGADYQLDFDFDLNPELFSVVVDPDNLMIFKRNSIGFTKKPSEDIFVANLNGSKLLQTSWILINNRVKAGISEKTDFISSHVNLWGNGHVISPEFFYQINLCPGEETRWQRVYTFFEI
jgi:hypothetical protein